MENADEGSIGSPIMCMSLQQQVSFAMASWFKLVARRKC